MLQVKFDFRFERARANSIQNERARANSKHNMRLQNEINEKTMKNEAAYQMLRKTGLVVRDTEEKTYFDECCYTNRSVKPQVTQAL